MCLPFILLTLHKFTAFDINSNVALGLGLGFGFGFLQYFHPVWVLTVFPS